MAKKTQVIQKEVRTITAKVELRTQGEGDQQQEVIEGYALKFNKWSDNLGYCMKIREKIDPHALDNCDMCNVVATFNHNQDMPLARNTVSVGSDGNLQLAADNIGLHFNCVPTNTSYGTDLKENIRAGVVNQCSFAFSLDPMDETADSIIWNDQDETYERTINKIQTLYDVSVVTTPAYPDTEAVVGQRCKDKIQLLRTKHNKEKRQTEGDCICSSCNHSDNCQNSGAKCCVCNNCPIVNECSNPGNGGCNCSDCPMAENNCCQPNSEQCMCSNCENIGCKKGHSDSTDEMKSTKIKEEVRKKLILKTYL